MMSKLLHPPAAGPVCDPQRDFGAGLPFGLPAAVDHRFLAAGESAGLGLPAPDRCMLTRPASATEILSLSGV